MKWEGQVQRWSKSKERLGGVKYWAQWFPFGRTPRYELFVFVGCDKNIGQYYFAHFKNPSVLVCKNFYQLTQDLSFRPFVLEHEEIDKYAKDHGLGGPNANN